MFKILRSLSALNRQSSAHPSRTLRYYSSILNKPNGDVRVQPVIVGQSRSKKASKRVLLPTIIGAVLTFYVLGLPWGTEDEKAAALRGTASEQTSSAKSKDGAPTAVAVEEPEEDDIQVPDVMPENAIFIPLGFPRQLPRTFYKGTDPEWQSFMEFSKDKKRSLLIRNDLVGMIGHHLGNMKSFQKQLGNPIQPRKYWLDIDFPDGPPPEYERSGLEITDDYIAWTIRPVDALQVFRLQAALWPRSVALSMWASYKTLWTLQLARAKQFLNLENGNDPDSKGSIDFQPIPKGSNHQEKCAGCGGDLFDDSDETPAAPNPPAPDLSSAQSEPPSPAMQRLQNLGVLGLVADMNSAMGTFKQSVMKTWQIPPTRPERGTVMISGLVELVGSKATCVVDVRAAFHPKQNRWVAVGVGVRRLQAKKQAPKGGN